MGAVDFVVDPSAPVELLDGMARRGGDMRPATRYIRTLLIATRRANFESEGALFGEPWPALAESTLEKKKQRGEPADPLVATGASKRAMGGGRGKRTAATRTMARVGVAPALFYLRFHDGKGGSRLPTRTLNGLPDTARREAISVMQRYLEFGRVH